MRSNTLMRAGNSFASAEDTTAADPRRLLMASSSNIRRKTEAYKLGLALRDSALFTVRQVKISANMAVRSSIVGMSLSSKADSRATRVRMSEGNVAKDTLGAAFVVMVIERYTKELVR